MLLVIAGDRSSDGLALDGDASGLRMVLILAMTAARCNLNPAIPFDKLHHLTDFDGHECSEPAASL